MEYQIGGPNLHRVKPLDLRPVRQSRKRQTFTLHAISDTQPEITETYTDKAALWQREDQLNATGLYYDVYYTN
jgi:hypothetical protein